MAKLGNLTNEECRRLNELYFKKEEDFGIHGDPLEYMDATAFDFYMAIKNSKDVTELKRKLVRIFKESTKNGEGDFTELTFDALASFMAAALEV